MKNIFAILILFITISCFAQSPTKFNYQAVARDSDNIPYKSTNLGVRISLIKGNSSGTIVYSENHPVTTSNLGVFNLQIGDGKLLSGDINSIDWGNDNYYIKIDMDPKGGQEYIHMGVNQLLSVPYAMYALKSGKNSSDADTDPKNEIQTISLDGNQIALSKGGGTINLPQGITDTDDQNLFLTGTTLSIDDGNSIDLSIIQDGTKDADSDPDNEIQTLNFNPSNNVLSISNGNAVTIPSGGTDADADPKNEIQTISLQGNQIILSNGGGTIDLPQGITDTDDQTLSLNGTQLSIDSGNTIELSSLQDGVNDDDSDPTNEIQSISLNGNQIILSNGGGTINLPQGVTDTDYQNLSLNGTQLSIDNGNSVDLSDLKDDADADPSNEIQTLSLNGSQISLSNGGGTINLPQGTTDTDDQNLSLNGTTLSIDDGNSVDLSSLQDGVNDADSSPTNEIQSISLNGNQISLSNGGGTINLPQGTVDTDDQTLSLNGTNLSITDGNSVDLSSLQDGVNDNDSDPENEIQSISLSGNQISLSNGGGTIDLPQGTTDTDDQTLSLSGSTLSIDDGNSVDLSNFSTPWASTSVGIEYLSGVVDVETINATTLKITGQSNSLIANDNNLHINNTSNQYVDLRPKEITLQSGLSAGKMTSKKIQFDNSGTAILNDQTLKFVGSTGGTTELGKEKLEIKSPTKFISLSDSAIDYKDRTNGELTSIYPASIYFSDDNTAGASNSFMDRTQVSLTYQGNQSILNSNSLYFKNQLSNKVKARITGTNMGIIRLYNQDDKETIELKSNNSTKVGNLFLKNSLGQEVVRLASYTNYQDHGYIQVSSNNKEKASLFASPNGFGVVRLYGSNGKKNLQLTAPGTDSSSGYMGIYDDKEKIQVSAYAVKNGGGLIRLTASGVAGGKTNVLMSSVNGSPGDGFIGVYSWNGNNKAGLYVDSNGKGRIFADIKNFKMQHPYQKIKKSYMPVWKALKQEHMNEELPN